MSDFTPNAAVSALIAAENADSTVKLVQEIDRLTIERNQAVAEVEVLRTHQAVAEVEVLRTQLRSLKASLQYDLKEWAEQNLQPGDSDYQELHDLMVSNDLEGLKRSFTVTVRVSYDFEVEVEATDEDAARDEVDNDIHQYASDYVDLSSPDDYEIEAREA